MRKLELLVVIASLVISLVVYVGLSTYYSKHPTTSEPAMYCQPYIDDTIRANKELDDFTVNFSSFLAFYGASIIGFIVAEEYEERSKSKRIRR